MKSTARFVRNGSPVRVIWKPGSGNASSPAAFVNLPCIYHSYYLPFRRSPSALLL